MSWLDRTLDLFDRHKYGIIGTLMVHTALMAVFVLGQIGRVPVVQEQAPVQLMIEDAPEPEVEQQQENEAPGQAAAVTNLASNITASVEPPMSRAAQERMARHVERDLLNMEKEEFDRLAEQRKEQGKEITVPELDPTKFDKSNYMEKPMKPVKVEGLTTVSYDLVGRAHIVLDVPAYLCKGKGKIVVHVAVDRTGQVSQAELDPAASTATTGCLAEQALRSATGARFSAAPNAAQPQRGTITYVFLAQ